MCVCNVLLNDQKMVGNLFELIFKKLCEKELLFAKMESKNYLRYLNELY